MLKGWHKGGLRHAKGTGVRSWGWGGIGLDVGNMGGRKLVVGIVSEQVHGGSDGTN